MATITEALHGAAAASEWRVKAYRVYEGEATASEINNSHLSLAEKQMLLDVLAGTATRASIMASLVSRPQKELCVRMLAGAAISAFWNPSTKGADMVLGNGNLTATCILYDPYAAVESTPLVATGRRYLEYVPVFGDPDDAELTFGVATAAYDPSLQQVPGTLSTAWYLTTNGKVMHSGAYLIGTSHAMRTMVSGAISRMAVDFAAGKVWFGNRLGFVGDPTAGSDPEITFTPYTPLVVMCTAWTATPPTPAGFTANFGASEFAFSPPDGYSSWDLSR